VVDALAPCERDRRGAGDAVAEAVRLDLDASAPARAERLRMTLARAGAVEIAVYDVTGRRIALVDRGDRAAGRHEVTWDASGLGAGLYFYRLTAGERSVTRKRIVIR
jgi:hypothetical protein